jgi:hypothetical protein
MRLLVVALTAMLLIGSAVPAQEKRVSPQESRILLLAPYLEDLTPTYQHFGWNAQANVETAYAGVARSNNPPSRAQVYLNQTAPNIYWRAGNSLDETWIRNAVPYLKNKTVRVTSPAPMAGPFVRVARFEVEGAQCMAFELRHVTNDTGAPGIADRQSVSGIYCPPSNVALDDALIQRVFEGIFVRRDGRIERALRGVDKPIPPQLLRGEQKQG